MTPKPSNGFLVRVGATVLAAIITGFFLIFLAGSVWAHEGALVELRTSTTILLTRIEARLGRIEAKLERGQGKR